MAKARALDRRRKSIRNIRKITRTMELISTAQFKRAMDRAMAATAYTRRITALVGHLAHSGLEVTPSAACSRGRSRSGRCCWCWRPTAGCAAATTRSVLRLANARYRELQRDGARGPAGSVRQAGHLGLPLPQDPAGRDVHPFRGQAELRRGRRAGQPLSGGFRRRRDRPARRGLHEVRERSAVSRRWSKRCCRWADLDGADGGGTAAPASRSTSSCPRPRAFWTKSCRPASR